ncbi:MAG: DUF1353 domain-containing protein [Reyranellaceae bacterium]
MTTSTEDGGWSSALLRVASIDWRSEPGVARLGAVTEALGTFAGLPPQIALLGDGRLVRLLAPLSFTQANGTAWPVPAGVELDGASIPRILWSLIGGPFEGRYRDASIVHDHYCVVRTRSWQDTHRVFYDAMRSSGEAPGKAKILYYAVYRFGPRWTTGAATAFTAAASVASDEAESFAADAEAIHVHNLTLAEIEALADARNATVRVAAAAGAVIAEAAGDPVERARRLVVNGGSGTGDDIEAVAREAAMLPDSVLSRFESKGIRIIACRESVTDFETGLRGVQPRGWPPGSTWDTVPGTYFQDKRRVVIATIDLDGQRVVPTRDSGRHGSTNLTVHESLHGFDYSGRHAILRDRGFVTARTADFPRLGTYEQQAGSAGLEETFAESGARFVADATMSGDWSNLFTFWQANPLANSRSGLFGFAVSEAAEATDAAEAPDGAIGMAEIKDDGTIVLDLRAEGDGGAIGHALLTVRPGEPGHAALRAHLAGGTTAGAAAAESTLSGKIPFKPMT